jgi:uncharacterized membrane protein (DUF485 family)
MENLGVMEKVAAAQSNVPEHTWMEGARTPHFHALLHARRRAIIPMAIIYISGYLGLSLLAGFGRDVIGMKVYGPINLGFVLIVGNYVMSWLIAIAYAWIAAKSHDPLVEIVVEASKKSEGAR